MDKKQSVLEKTKEQIITQIYTFIFVIFLITLITNTVMVYQIITQTSDYKEIPSYFYFDLLSLFFFGISLFFIKRKPKLFVWLFLIFLGLFSITESSLISFTIVIPIFTAAFLIKPRYTLWTTIFYCLEATAIFYLLDNNLTFTIWLEKYLLFYFYVFVIALFAWFLSKEFHQAFTLYESQNVELRNTKQKLAKKVETQTQEIKNIEAEKNNLSQQLENMHFSIDQLKSETSNTKERLQQQMLEKQAKEEKLRKIFES